MNDTDIARAGIPSPVGAPGTIAPGCLPPEFAARELASVRARRAALGLELAEGDRCGRVGLAISGGGIRSATFGLGVLQALAKERLLRHVDYLSTVSGGGYVGAFLGALYLSAEARGEPRGDRPAPTPATAARIADNVDWVEAISAHCQPPFTARPGRPPNPSPPGRRHHRPPPPASPTTWIGSRPSSPTTVPRRCAGCASTAATSRRAVAATSSTRRRCTCATCCR